MDLGETTDSLYSIMKDSNVKVLQVYPHCIVLNFWTFD